jgi:hypothetical protein
MSLQMSDGGPPACSAVYRCDLGFCGVSGVWLALPPCVLMPCIVAGHGLVFGEGCRRASKLQAMNLAKGEAESPDEILQRQAPLSARGEFICDPNLIPSGGGNALVVIFWC